MQTEMEWLTHTLSAPLNENWRNDGWSRIAILQVQRTPNRVINGNYDCWKKGSLATPNLAFTLYPVSQRIVNAFCYTIPGAAKKLELNASKLREPLAMN